MSREAVKFFYSLGVLISISVYFGKQRNEVVFFRYWICVRFGTIKFSIEKNRCL